MSASNTKRSEESLTGTDAMSDQQKIGVRIGPFSISAEGNETSTPVADGVRIFLIALAVVVIILALSQTHWSVSELLAGGKNGAVTVWQWLRQF